MWIGTNQRRVTLKSRDIAKYTFYLKYLNIHIRRLRFKYVIVSLYFMHTRPLPEGKYIN